MTDNAPRIIHEDEHLLVIEKPAGLMVHPDGRAEGKTLVDWVLETHPDMKGVGEPLTLASGVVIERPGIVHRLDRETSGVMLLAKTPEMFALLKEQFMNHEVGKVYRAFVHGIIHEARGVIDRPIGKSRSDFRQWSAGRNPRGLMREARTDFKVLARSSEATYIEAYPKTGRTHQIRVHCKAIQHPVICDPLYGPENGCILGFDRLALHARSISYVGFDGVRRTFEVPLPPSFVRAEGLLSQAGE